MSNSMKLVNICDHTLMKIDYYDERNPITKTAEDIEVITERTIDVISNLRWEDYSYVPGLHFIQYGHNAIKWLCEDAFRPTEGENYVANLRASNTYRRGFSPDECEKCNGLGWYVSPLAGDDKIVSIISGADKLEQDYLKVLLTDSRYYKAGTALKSAIGVAGTGSSDAEVTIRISVKEAEDTIKKNQYELSMSGIYISPAETLRSVIISEMSVSDSGDGFYLYIVITSDSAYSSEVSLSL